MKRGNVYYLVARNRKDNSFKILSISGVRGCTLEEIDLFTTQYETEGALTDFFYHNNVLENGSYDYYIVHQKKVKGNVALYHDEVLYKNNSRIDEIAYNSLLGKIEKSSDEIDAVLNQFCTRMGRDANFYDQVICYKTNIYPKFVHYFIGSRFQSLYQVRFRDGGWSRTSYPSIRNIIESFSREKASYYQIHDSFFRNLLVNEIIKVTDKEYDENQYSLFDMFPNTEEKKWDDSLLEIITTLESIPYSDFQSNAFFPDDKICYEEDDLEKLKTLLPCDFSIMIKQFLAHRDGIDNNNQKALEDYELLLKRDYSLILRRLKTDDELFHNAFIWCLLYNKYRNKVLGDNNGNSYRKGKD